MQPAGFWALCPGEFRAIMAGAKRRVEREGARDRWNVWHAAALPMAKKFPDFDAFVHQKKGAVARTPADLLARVMQWDARIKQDARADR